MKRSEAYIEEISKKFRMSPATAKAVYEAINKYDSDMFCSQMGDYDHPEERAAAEKKLNSFKNCYSETFQKVINQVQDFMKADENYNIHKMNEEMEEPQNV